jgi:hypothetical protein
VSPILWAGGCRTHHSRARYASFPQRSHPSELSPRQQPCLRHSLAPKCAGFTVACFPLAFAARSVLSPASPLPGEPGGDAYRRTDRLHRSPCNCRSVQRPSRLLPGAAEPSWWFNLVSAEVCAPVPALMLRVLSALGSEEPPARASVSDSRSTFRKRSLASSSRLQYRATSTPLVSQAHGLVWPCRTAEVTPAFSCRTVPGRLISSPCHRSG